MEWTKKKLANSINQRIDQNKYRRNWFILSNEITDEMLEKFQEMHNTLSSAYNAEEVEMAFKTLYEHIVGLDTENNTDDEFTRNEDSDSL